MIRFGKFYKNFSLQEMDIAFVQVILGSTLVMSLGRGPIFLNFMDPFLERRQNRGVLPGYILHFLCEHFLANHIAESFTKQWICIPAVKVTCSVEHLFCIIYKTKLTRQ